MTDEEKLIKLLKVSKKIKKLDTGSDIIYALSLLCGITSEQLYGYDTNNLFLIFVFTYVAISVSITGPLKVKSIELYNKMKNEISTKLYPFIEEDWK